MPFRAGLYLIALLLTGCSIWPDQAHRALSAQVIESIVSEHCSVNTTLNTSAQEQQQALLAQIQAQLNMLTAALAMLIVHQLNTPVLPIMSLKVKWL